MPLRFTLAVAFALFGLLPSGLASPSLASPPPAPTFNPNLVLPSSTTAAEPSIETDQFGQSFVIGPTGVPAGCKAFRVRHDGSAATYLGFPDHTAGGGDCDWALGPEETASLPGFGTPTDSGLAYSSLTAANITVGKSNNGGASFGPPNPGAAQVGGDDRMWQAADPQLNSGGFDTVFMSYHDVTVGNIEVSISVDGGQTYAQSTPLINPAEVPVGQWAGAEAGNELGNIVARRPKGGSLTLYSIFETPDSSTDNTNQGVAGTTNFNRVYEAVGTVTDSVYPAYPTVVWHDYEIYHGPVGARYNRIFPVTAVDAAGRVYAFWTDGNHVYYKSDATGTGWNPAAAPGSIPNPAGVNTTVMPWAKAGASGIVDVVFYGASGGSGAQPNPQDDPNNVWNVYMAQTVDGGSSWAVSTASDHVIHTGPICIDGLACNTSTPQRNRTLLDFFQVSIDPTNGAADIAYADDHASPGTAVVYFTRQCTGTSATTGQALVNDCVAPPPPQPPPQGTPCLPVVDFTNDAPNNYPAGDGSNMDNLDIENAFFRTPDASDIQVTLTIKNLSAPPPPVNMISAFWTVYWTYNGTTYYAQATSNGSGSAAVYSFSSGTYNGSFNAGTTTTTGTVTTGPNGTVVMTVPRANVGNPPTGASITNPYADTHGSFTVLGTGVYYTAPADRAPDSGYGATYVLGQSCAPPPPPGTPATLTLSPKTETDNVFARACETATVRDANSQPVPGADVYFTVTGANPTSSPQKTTTDVYGQAQFCYTGQNPGVDTIKAFAETDADAGQDNDGEPSDTATKTWIVPRSTSGCVVKITNGGWITVANGDQGTFGGNAQVSSTGSTSGQEQYQDHGPAQPLNAHSISVTSIQCNQPQTQATIYGQATINGSGSYTFQIVVQDNGSGGSNDAYGIRLSNGYNSGLQRLGGGNVDIHQGS